MRKDYTIKTLATLLLIFTASIVAAQTHTVYGTVSYHNDGIRVLEGVTMNLFDGNDALVGTTTSNNNGYYEFTNLPNGTYTLTGSYNATPGGVDVISAIMVLQHITGAAPLEGMAYLAADVNGDGQITWGDYFLILIQNLIFGNPFPVGDWVFEELTFTLDGLKSSNEKSTGGSSAGDVNGDYEPQLSLEPLCLNVYEEPVYARPGDELSVAVRISETAMLAGMHLVISYPSDLLEIIEVDCPMSGFEYLINNNTIILSAVEESSGYKGFMKGDELVSLRVRTTGAYNEGSVINLTLGEQSHFVNERLEKPLVKVSTPVISMVRNDNASLSNYPNPFSSQTSITYTLNEYNHVNLSVFGLDGRLVETLVDEMQPEGMHVLKFQKNNLKPGNYLLRLHTAGMVPVNETRVMIITSD